MAVYTFWLVLTIPVSVWRGGSFEVFRQYWFPAVLGFVFLNTMVLSFQYLRRVIFALVFSAAFILLASLRLGGEIDGRFGLVAGTLQNANDLAMHLLLVLPFCFFLTKDPASSKLSRFFGWACALAILLVSLRTASRTGLLAILLYAGAIFITASIVNKFKMILAVVFFGVLFAATLPRQTLVRYSTMFTDSGLADSADTASDGVVASAEGSKILRQRLFRYSLQMALHHPLFGVGMGNFAPVADGISSKEQESTAWKQPHSVYNQIAAEVGFPGLLLYVAMLVASFRACFRVRKATRGVPSQQSRYVLANCLLLTLLAFALTNFFATWAYGIYLPIFTALAVLLERHVQPESRGNAVATSASPFQVQSAWLYGRG